MKTQDLSELNGRQLKKKVSELLASASETGEIFKTLSAIPGRKAVNPLFACFYSRSSLVKWRAVAAMGRTVSGLAEENMESARVVMRRLMWNLNDESGGIGWGSPEAMGESAALHDRLADEFGSIVASYVIREQNFLEHEGLQRGSIWAVGRMAQARPDKAADTARDLMLFLTSPDPFHRGYASWALGSLKSSDAAGPIRELTGDREEIEIFRNLELSVTTVGSLALEALGAIEGRGE